MPCKEFSRSKRARMWGLPSGVCCGHVDLSDCAGVKARLGSVQISLIGTILNRLGLPTLYPNLWMPMPAGKTLEARAKGTQFDVPRHPRVEPLMVRSVLRDKPSELHCVEADAPSLVALRLMAEHNIGSVLVMNGERLGGIFSERDYARVSARVGPLAVTTPVHEAMTPCHVFVTPMDSVQRCLSLMSEEGLRYLPVTEAGEFIALLSADDLLSEMVAHHQRVFKANELDQQILFLRGTYSC